MIETVTTYRTSDGEIHHYISRAEEWEQNIPLAKMLKPWIKNDHQRQEAARAIRGAVTAIEEEEADRQAAAWVPTVPQAEHNKAVAIIRAVADCADMLKIHDGHVIICGDLAPLHAAVVEARSYMEPPF